jgi:nickel-dependent lactate racemase
LEKTYVACTDKDLDDKKIKELFCDALSRALFDIKNSDPVIIIPPDITRIHSRAGFLTEIASMHLSHRLGAILPALGTHRAMSYAQIAQMFGSTPKEKFIAHDWRNDVIKLGCIDSSYVSKLTEGIVNCSWSVQVNKLLHGKNFGLAVSIGQVVPHEVAGMANHAKNIFIGTGGKETIDKSHFIGAAYGMEKIMGKIDNPVRALFDKALNRYGNQLPPILWVLTVIAENTDNKTTVRGLFIGFGRECFEKAAALSEELNVNRIKKQVNKIVVYLNPDEYRTTWLGNKAIYRTRMAIADGGELVIMAPGLERFGEDIKIDGLICKYGYRCANKILSLLKTQNDLNENLSAAAHLIHGSSDNRFTIRYCPGSGLSKEKIESAGFNWGDLNEVQQQYNFRKLSSGWNTLPNKEEIFFVPNPALGLWKC